MSNAFTLYWCWQWQSKNLKTPLYKLLPSNYTSKMPYIIGTDFPVKSVHPFESPLYESEVKKWRGKVELCVVTVQYRVLIDDTGDSSLHFQGLWIISLLPTTAKRTPSTKSAIHPGLVQSSSIRCHLFSSSHRSIMLQDVLRYCLLMHLLKISSQNLFLGQSSTCC